jgi:hypothetical protein
MIYPMFLLPQAHQALCICFSLALQEMGGRVSCFARCNSEPLFANII